MMMMMPQTANERTNKIVNISLAWLGLNCPQIFLLPLNVARLNSVSMRCLFWPIQWKYSCENEFNFVNRTFCSSRFCISLFLSLLIHVVFLLFQIIVYTYFGRHARKKCCCEARKSAINLAAAHFWMSNLKFLILTHKKIATKMSTHLILRSKLYPECSLSLHIHSKSSKCQLIRWRCAHRTETHIDLTFFISWKHSNSNKQKRKKNVTKFRVVSWTHFGSLPPFHLLLFLAVLISPSPSAFQCEKFKYSECRARLTTTCFCSDFFSFVYSWIDKLTAINLINNQKNGTPRWVCTKEFYGFR